MSKLDEIIDNTHYNLDKMKREFEEAIKESRLEGFREGLEYKAGKKPTGAEFRKAHKEPVMYGEDYCYVVYARSKKTAAKLLGTDEDCVDEVSVGWRAYESDGEITVGYYMGRGVEPEWQAYGVYV